MKAEAIMLRYQPSRDPSRDAKTIELRGRVRLVRGRLMA